MSDTEINVLGHFKNVHSKKRANEYGCATSRRLTDFVRKIAGFDARMTLTCTIAIWTKNVQKNVQGSKRGIFSLSKAFFRVFFQLLT
jgi:hypothetical protein